MTNDVRSFETCWRDYVNGSDTSGWRQLTACMNAAQTFSEVLRVFNAASTDLEYDSLGSVRVSSLKRLIEMASTEEEAKQALALASKRKQDRTLYYPKRFKDAQEKLRSLS